MSSTEKKKADQVRTALIEGLVQGRKENLMRWVRVLEMHEFEDPMIFDHCVRLGHLKTPLDFYRVTWGPRLQQAVNRTRDVSLAKFLRALGYENIGDAQVRALYKHIGGIEKLMKWATPGGFKAIKAHDLGKDTLVHVRTLLQQNQDLVEALLDEIEVI